MPENLSREREVGIRPDAEPLGEPHREPALHTAALDHDALCRVRARDYGIKRCLAGDHRYFTDGLDAFGKDRFILFKNLQDMRFQIARNGIDKLKFFFNADRDWIRPIGVRISWLI